MKATCPGCGFSADLEAFLNDMKWREAMVPALVLPPALAPLLLQYLRLFSPPKNALRADRVAILLTELADWVTACRVQRGGREFVAPVALWQLGIEEVLAARDAGTLVLPMKTHGYLLQVVASLAAKAGARAESEGIKTARGETPVGFTSAHRAVADKSTVNATPAGRQAGLASIRSLVGAVSAADSTSD